MIVGLFVGWRRDGDKLNHFMRWCEAITKGMTTAEALAHVRSILLLLLVSCAPAPSGCAADRPIRVRINDRIRLPDRAVGDDRAVESGKR